MELKEKQDITMKHKTYLPLAAGIYLNYAILGMATIIVSQYGTQFQIQQRSNLLNQRQRSQHQNDPLGYLL
ncbi:Transport protein [Lactiplantibacillus plantarum]|nr:Transport protein [Lactiplantibacillus plantarum]MCG0875987.1 Transport protein [Lactiplantibacillus plantarum]